MSASGTVTSPGGRIGRGFINLVAAFGLLYLFAPIFVIVAFSFNKPKGRFNAVWQEFTLDNWLHPFADKPLVDALILSLRIAFISTIIATILGTFIAIALVRYRIKGGEPVNFLLVLPLTAPEIVLGASLLTLFIQPTMVLFNHSFTLGTTTIIIAHIMFLVSYVAITVRARVRGIDWTLEDAAMDLGASPTRTFWKVTLPLITPGILAAALLGVRVVDRRLHHHVLRVGPEHDDVPGAHLQPVAHRDPAADQRAVDDDPPREHHAARGRYRLGRVPRAQLRRAIVRQRLAAFFVLVVAVAAGSIPAAGAISPIQPDNRPLPLPGVTNGEVPPSLLVQVAPNCVTARAAGPSLSLLFAEARAVGVSLGSEECYRALGDQVTARARATANGNPACAASVGTSPTGKPVGTSMHGWGKASDMTDAGRSLTFASPGYAFLKSAAAAVGWNHPGWAEPGGSTCPEPWHWEWVGDGGSRGLDPAPRRGRRARCRAPVMPGT